MKKRVFARALAMAAVSAMGAAGVAGVTHASATIMTGTVAKAAATGAKPYDFNGDGYADLIAGASGENANDGTVSVLKGGTAGVTGTGSTSFGAGTIGVTGRNAQIGRVIGRTG